MSRSVRVLRRAQNDLLEVHNYVRRDRPKAADRLVSRLLDAIESLGQFADRGAVPRDERLSSRGYCVIIEGEYLVFYKTLPTQVRIYRVVHGRRKYGPLV